ncbi:type II toxin-antitoxin system RelB family antitoxin [Neisseria perflava]|uniref:type II toxin-antitoxin system RelB family antitoxin n=1 Tax=Neisseria perflava TaxID=33053 RepID=UPI00209D253F|nr:hypothetical protein [Neisseria perflava]MCP1659361.1 hypothetical protein [Neisseria perflava]
MNTVLKLDPLVDVFDTQAEADSYDTWLRAKVEASLCDIRPALPHDEALAAMDAELERRKTARTAR